MSIKGLGARVKSFFKSKVAKVGIAVGSAVATCMSAVSAFAAEEAASATEGVEAAKSLLQSMTGSFNIQNIALIIGAGVGACIGLVIFWFAGRKLLKMLMGALKKGKLSF